MKVFMRIPLYLAVIAVATALGEPWMIALQAACGGFAIGMLVAEYEVWRDAR